MVELVPDFPGKISGLVPHFLVQFLQILQGLCFVIIDCCRNVHKVEVYYKIALIIIFFFSFP